MTTSLPEAKRIEFANLFQELAESYPFSPEGQEHAASYQESRSQARESLDGLIVASERGEDITEAVLFRLLPYTDSAANRERGLWVSVAPAFATDVRIKFEASGWTDPEDWPRVAQAILEFVRRCDEHPEQLAEACAGFSSLPYSKGFQSGTLTPIIHALRPDDFVLINNKSRRTVNYFAGTAYGQKLVEYPDVNATAKALIGELSSEMEHSAVLDLGDNDRFDMFCHWLVAVKRYEFGSVAYWKIAPGEDAWNWEACRDGGFIAIGWDKLGDISELSRAEFDAKRDAIVQQNPDWTKEGTEQVWKFAHDIKEGDRIVANRGTREVLGIGTAVGPYEYVPGIQHGHRLPVEWDDLTPREVDEYGWRRTIVKLKRKKFLSILSAASLPPAAPDLAAPFSRIFASREEARWAFDLLRETLQRLGVKDPSDERFALTIRGTQTLRLNFGNWSVLHFSGPDSAYRVGIALIDEQVDLVGQFSTWGAFAQCEPSVSVYELPIETAMPLEGNLREAYESTCVLIADRFKHWNASNYRRYSQPEMVEAIFDPERCEKLLETGLSQEALDAIADEGSGGTGDVFLPDYFTHETFGLLAQLRDDPTREFYLKHKEGLKTHLEDPFQQLLRDVASQLPPQIAEIMELEKGVFARILKNDFGRGGAWDYYWGAFYPKGGKRIQDAQLFVYIDCDRFEFGFYIGEYGSEQRKRFLRNLEGNHESLQTILQDNLADAALAYGPRETRAGGLTWDEWLKTASTADIRAKKALSESETLRMPGSELVETIAQTFVQLFPLVLLAATDEPMDAVAEYVESLLLEDEAPKQPAYTLGDCADETSLGIETLERWVRAIVRKGQAILYGPPGTGKTYVAERLARHLVGGGDGFWELVQFHPSYAYEDFIQGIRPKPKEGGGLDYPIVPGRFLDFCREAELRKGVCVLVIDEINRANLARVFGELMYLLEYRDQRIPLAGGGKYSPFSIPENAYIIGTMNTADRSIALVDHALRRRFAFLALYPNYDVLRNYHRKTGFNVEPLIAVLSRLNRQIGDRHYEVGITFFLQENIEQEIEDIWRMEVEPYLEEYFFDQPDKVEAFRWAKIGREILRL